MEIVKKLMVHMERAEGPLYRDELLTRMIEICAQNNYQYVVDFEWYVTVLAELTEMETSAKHGTARLTLYICVLLRLCVIVSTCVCLNGQHQKLGSYIQNVFKKNAFSFLQ